VGGGSMSGEDDEDKPRMASGSDPALQIAAQGPEGEQPEVPSGYVWDPHSNLFLNQEAGMYFDSSSGSYFSASDGKWYSYDATTTSFAEISHS